MKRTLIFLLFFCLSLTDGIAQTIQWVPSSQGTGATASNSGPGQLTVWNGRLYFWAEDSNSVEIWSYDELTPPIKMTNLFPGGNASGSGNGAGKMAILNGKLYMAASVGLETELYSYNGISTMLKVSNIFPGGTAGPYYLRTMGSKIYFGAVTGGAGTPSIDLYSYDGTNPPYKYPITGPSIGVMGCNPVEMTPYNGKLYFFGKLPSSQWALYQLDPVTNTANVIMSGAPSGGFTGPMSNLTVAGNKLYFNAGSNGYGGEIWSYNDTNLKRMTDVAPGNLKGAWGGGIGYYNGEIYFGGSTDGTNFQLYKLTADGTASLVYTVNPGGNGAVGNFVTYKNNLYFIARTPAAGAELWKYNGTSCGMVADLNTGPSDFISGGFDYAIYNGHLYFGAISTNHQYELFRLNDPTGVTNTNWVAKVSISPNPTRDIAQLSISLPHAEDLQISLHDISGRNVFSTGLQTYSAGTHTVTLPLQSLPSGVYVYSIHGNSGLLSSGQVIRK